MSQFFESLREQLGYLASLPERTIRSLAAMAGGTTSLLTETLFPDALRGTTIYRVLVGDMQRFVIEKVAQVSTGDDGSADKPASTGADDPRFAVRKVAGTALESAGLFAMHVSPLWVFAIASDAAAGGGVFLRRLVDQLKANGVIAPEADVAGLADLLEAVQQGAGKSTAVFDTPPMSREEIGKMADDMTAAYARMFDGAANLLPRIEDLWSRMERIASRDSISMEKLGGILTLDVTDWGRKGVGAVMAIGQTGGGLFGEKILDSYSRTLDEIGRQGVADYLSTRMGPFLEAAAGHFDPQRRTWTESLMHRLFGGPQAPVAAQPSAEEPPADAT